MIYRKGDKERQQETFLDLLLLHGIISAHELIYYVWHNEMRRSMIIHAGLNILDDDVGSSVVLANLMNTVCMHATLITET